MSPRLLVVYIVLWAATVTHYRASVVATPLARRGIAPSRLNSAAGNGSFRRKLGVTTRTLSSQASTISFVSTNSGDALSIQSNVPADDLNDWLNRFLSNVDLDVPLTPQELPVIRDRRAAVLEMATRNKLVLIAIEPDFPSNDCPSTARSGDSLLLDDKSQQEELPYPPFRQVPPSWSQGSHHRWAGSASDLDEFDPDAFRRLTRYDPMDATDSNTYAYGSDVRGARTGSNEEEGPGRRTSLVNFSDFVTDFLGQTSQHTDIPETAPKSSGALTLLKSPMAIGAIDTVRCYQVGGRTFRVQVLVERRATHDLMAFAQFAWLESPYQGGYFLLNPQDIDDRRILNGLNEHFRLDIAY
ncbi:hypothetical protein IWQ60_008863 [Tieghemiomyces parasiticus]|uniref:Uncharacterized protein n=1 Tax=Tieghemiomyces parasiticus TaxID=78921 RepID=A0A9W7ZV06_9FUNG|nr:hypothetical protein IWQ60_008863 [Tieghemiomyces parasiticus]